MTTVFESALFLAGNSDGSTKRTLTQRTAEIFNVMDYGAIPDGNPAHAAANTSAIQNAINAAYATLLKSAIVFFPPGNYIINNTIDIGNHNSGGNNASGIITGSGRWCTYINGNLPNGFVFSQADGVNGPEEISNLAIVNTSTVIGSGALFLNNNTCGRVLNCLLGGMINLLMPFNIYETSIENCTGGPGSDPVTGYAGTFGIAGYHANISGWRSTTPYQTCLQLYGSNAVVIQGCGIENCTVAYVLGMATGWASQCTVSGTTLTVGGNLGTTAFNQFPVGSEIFMKGLTTTADWAKSPADAGRCTIISQLSGNPNLDGTYQISRSATISSPVPCVSRYESVLSGTTIQNIQTEAAHFIGYIASISACSIISCGGGSAVNEAVDAFGTTGFTSNTGFYIAKGGASSFINCTPNTNATNAAWYFAPGQPPSQLTFINCSGQKAIDNVTGTTSSISDGAGGSGTLLDVVSFTGNGPNPGMRVTGTGVTAGTVITGNYLTETATISSYTYNSGTGLVTLTLSAPVTLPANWKISVRNLTTAAPVTDTLPAAVNVSNTAIASPVSASTTVTYTIAAGKTGTPTGGGVLHLLTGSCTVGTYRVNNSQHITGQQITILYGDDWVIPTSNDGKTAIQLYNCNSSNLPAGYTSGLANGMARTYASLPGNSGANTNFPVQDGMEYDIVDGLATQCSDGTCTTLGTNVNGGGGALHLKVRYNAAKAKWTLMGA